MSNISNGDVLVLCPLYSQLKRIGRKHPESRIICCTLFELGYPQHPDVDEWHLIDSLAPKNFESLLVELSEEVTQSLLDIRAVRELLHVNGQDMLEDARFHLLSRVIYPKIRAAVHVTEILRRHPEIDTVYASDLYYDVSCLFVGEVHRLPRFDVRRRLRAITIALIPPAAMLYKLVLLPILARLVARGEIGVVGRRTVLIGNINEFGQFSAELGSRLGLDTDDYILFHPMRRYLRFRKLKKFYPAGYSFAPMDALLSFWDYVSIVGPYLTLTALLPGLLRKNFNPRLLGRQAGRLFDTELLSFFRYFGLVSLKALSFARQLVLRLERNTDVVFSHPHSFHLNTINNSLKEAGHRTVTFNHGLIQTPAQMLTETTLNNSMSVCDLEVMRRFSHDDDFRHIPAAQPSLVMGNGFRDFPRILILNNIPYLHAPFAFTIDFLAKLEDGLRRAGLDNAELLIKPHPKERRRRLVRHVKRLDREIAIMGADLDVALSRCNLAVMPFSTTILSSIRKGIPVLVYRTGLESDETFFALLPPAIVFSSGEEFACRFQFLMRTEPSDISALYRQVLNRYYGG